jgi:hypothetical protein
LFENIKKINEANYTVVLVGEEANKQHSDHKEIGCKNWLNYEVAKSKQHRNKLVADQNLDLHPMLLVAPYNACHCRSQNLQKLSGK